MSMSRKTSMVAALVVLMCAVLSVPAYAAVGKIDGSFSVGPGGSVNYTIPLWTPPGPHGLQPAISLTYNSGGGNSTTGIGWSVSGLSSISLCNLSYKNDGATVSADPSAANSNIRYCLDGNRLAITSSGGLSNYNTAGSTYQTQLANFSNVTIMGIENNQPTWFQVQGKDGLIYEYGNTPDSRVATNNQNYVYQWLLNKVRDSNGNSYIFTYSGTNNFNTAMISSISWSPATAGGANYQYSMTFNYEVKPNNKDFLVWFVGNTAFSNVNRLSSIVIGYSATGASNTYSPARQYLLSYETSLTTSLSRLTQVLECAASTSDCLAPTTFTYQNGQLGTPTSSTGPATGSKLLKNKYDFNGDGKSDLAFVSGSTWFVAFSTGTGFGTPVNTGIPSSVTPLIGTFLPNHQHGFLIPVNGNWSYVGYNGSSFVTTATSIPANGTMALDNNGDGLADLEWLGSSNQLMVRMNTTTGAATVPAFNGAAIVGSNLNNLQTPPSGSTGTPQITILQGNCVDGLKCDVNGDGVPDLEIVSVLATCPVSGCGYQGGGLQVQTLFANLLSNGAGYTPVPVTSSNSSSFDPLYIGINFNNDKCIDKINGNSALIISSCSTGPGTSITIPANPVMVMDWNGDGRTDLVVNNGGTLGIYLSTGNLSAPFSSLVSTTIPYSASSSYFAFDVDGDGLDDIAMVSSNGALNYFTHTGASGGFDTNGFDTQTPDLLTNIQVGVTGPSTRYESISPAYISTANSSRYIKGTGTQAPLYDVTDPMIVVGMVTFTDADYTYTQSYTYKGARIDVNYLNSSPSFEQVNMTDSRNGLYTSTTYAQAFPNAGQVIAAGVYQSDQTTPISHTTNTLETLANITLDSTQYNHRYFPHIANSTVQQYEVGGSKDGQLITTKYATTSYDSYGNALVNTVTTTDNDSGSPKYNKSWTVTTTNTPDVSTSNWCLPLLTQSVVQYTATDGSATVTRTNSYSPDLVNCRLNQIVTEPNSSQYKVTEALTYDSFGNISYDTITGINMAARTTHIDWGTTGQFPMQVWNALNQETRFGYDFSKGVQTSLTDPNGITNPSTGVTTKWDYDTFGRKTLETRADGTSTKYVYNWSGTTPPASGSSSDMPWWIQQIDQDTSGHALHETQTVYSMHDQLRMVIDQNVDGTFVYRVHQGYDALGRETVATVPGTSPWTYAYHAYALDPLGRITQDTLYDTSRALISSTTAAYAGRTSTSKDYYGKQTTKVFDVMGRMIRSTDANGYAQNFGYDAAGNLVSVTDSSGNQLFKVDSYDYGIKAFQRHTTDMDLGAWSYTYDALGEVINYTDAKNQTFSMTYDALSRPVTRSVTGENTTRWTWGSSASAHEIGQLKSICNDATTGGTGSTCTTPTYKETYTYDSDGRVSDEQIVSDATYNYDYSYNPTTGFLDTLQYPVSTSGYHLKLKYGYSSTGILNKVSDANNLSTVFWQANTVNPWGEVTQEALGNGIISNHTYDPNTGWLQSIQAGVGAGTGVQNESYLFDKVGNLQQRQDNNQGLTESYCYDNVYRLTKSALSGDNTCTTNNNLTMTYDVMGNITSRSDIANGATWTYNVTHQHQVTQAGDASHTYTYDNNGNAITRNGQSITWNKYNYPTTINGSGESVNLYYDANLQRWKQVYTQGSTTETTIYAGGLTQKVIANGITDYRYKIYAGNELVAVMSSQSGNNTLHYILQDHQGSFSKITNSNGSVYASENFTAFGDRRNPATWSGAPTSTDLNNINAVTRDGYTDQTALGNMGLNHMNGRVEDAITGRFLSADPFITEPSNTQNYNRYSYVYNNPMSYTDPTGFDVNAGNCDISISGYVDVITTTYIKGGVVQGSYTDEFPHIDNYSVNCLDGAPSEAQQPQPQPPPLPPQPDQGKCTSVVELCYQQKQACKDALKTSGQNGSAVNRAKDAMSVLNAAASFNGIDPALLAAVGVRESGFRNKSEKDGAGVGVGIFQLTVSSKSGVTVAQASNLAFSAYNAGNMLASNSDYLAAHFPKFTSAQLLQATAASYNLGRGGISGNPDTIDKGSAHGNYGSNVVNLMNCFQN